MDHTGQLVDDAQEPVEDTPMNVPLPGDAQESDCESDSESDDDTTMNVPLPGDAQESDCESDSESYDDTTMNVPLPESIEDTTMNDFIKAVKDCGASFCVGGHIPVQTDSQHQSQSQSPASVSAVPPVTLRWDVPNHAPNGLAIKFPLLASNSETFNEFLKACEPATYGLGDKDVLNEEYRKAGKLDNTQFSISFHPSDYAIIDTITQTLLPSLIRKDKRADQRGVQAELYKLNVYSGPGGRFKAHVDTPRSSKQFGSLVVCLPSLFKGGNLRVSHNGTTNYFDWSTSNPGSIQWAAFYSDCEHEIYEVLEGHRITLTYNLYVTWRVDATLQKFPATNPQIFPLFKATQSMHENPHFLPNGGILGFHCVHAYPHSHKNTPYLMPYALKGVDCIVFSVFRELGLRPVARPVIQDYPREYKHPKHHRDTIGLNFHPMVLDNLLIEDEDRRLRHRWPLQRRAVHWINSTAKNEQLAFVGVAHGNEASLCYEYSTAAIFARVERMTPDGRETRKERRLREKEFNKDLLPKDVVRSTV